MSEWLDGDQKKGYMVLCEFQDFGRVRDALIDKDMEIDFEETGVVYRPLSTVEVNEEDFKANEHLVDQIHELDSVV